MAAKQNNLILNLTDSGERFSNPMDEDNLLDHTSWGLYRRYELVRRIIDEMPSDAIGAFKEIGYASVYGNDKALQKYINKMLPLLTSAIQKARVEGEAYLLALSGANNNKPIKGSADISWLLVSKDRVDKLSSRNADTLIIRGEGKESNIECHKSRIIKLYGLRVGNTGYPIISGDILDTLKAYYRSLNDASDLLHRHSVMLLQTDLGNPLISGKVRDSVKNRLNMMNHFLSNRSAYAIDTKEKLDFLAQTYGGYAEIMEQIQLGLLSASNMPSYKLFATGRGSAFSESGLSDRLHWDAEIKAYQDTYLTDVFSQVFEILSSTKAFRGLSDSAPSVVYKPYLRLTELEKAELNLKYSQIDKTNIESGIYSPEIAAKRYESQEAKGEIVL